MFLVWFSGWNASRDDNRLGLDLGLGQLIYDPIGICTSLYLTGTSFVGCVAKSTSWQVGWKSLNEGKIKIKNTKEKVEKREGRGKKNLKKLGFFT